ncbi:uncharacterized protein LOC127833681 isoform X2 [Dreissena polymorpha]|uniref:uncharacterized protein LOC127833681 isoform X2 n=1 Tax=Dreissena polymorpha TaxID=45954 RepID=UPI0022653B26|nr:uncharacterized protein LOC127833681 isoform X2 [Dreissena polymorpha]
MDDSNTIIPIPEESVQELTAHTFRGKQDTQSVSGSDVIIPNTMTKVVEMKARTNREEQATDSFRKEGSKTVIFNKEAGLQELTEATISGDPDLESFVIYSRSTILSTPEAGVQALPTQTKIAEKDITSGIKDTLMAQADKGKHVIKSAIVDGTNAIKEGILDKVVVLKRGIRDLKTKFDKDSQRSGIVQDDDRCHVCTVSPILGTRWKCRACPNYNMCSLCFNDYRRTHDMAHSFTEIKTPGSISTKGRKKEHEVQGSPSDLTEMTRDEHVKTVYLEHSSEEFITVMSKFNHTLDKNIVSIRSVQNKFLWEFYFVKREQMEKMNRKFGANEKILFHGTKPEIIHNACAHNLDKRMAGTNVGAILGNGTYFASAANMSDAYTRPDPTTGYRYMLQCRVLVGEWTKGQPGLQRPPEVAQTSDGQYRSCGAVVVSGFCS